MSRVMRWGQYYPADSPLHAMDPRCKILLAFVYIIIVFFARSWLAFLPLIAMALSALFLSKVPPLAVLKTMKAIFFLLIFAALMNLLFTPGETIWQWGILTVTREGLVKSGMMFLRLLLLVGFSSLLTLTTSPLHLTHGMEALLRPAAKIGLPAHELSMMLSIGLRFIPILMEEMDIIIKAQRARGADMSHGPLAERLRSIVAVVVPLFISALKRAEDLAAAMEARGYQGGEGRTALYQLVWQKRDTWAVCAMACMVVLVLIF